jgi:hypothetical protein
VVLYPQVDHYDIYSGNTVIATAAGTTTSVWLSNLTASTNYSLTVVAIESGQTAPASAVVEFTTLSLGATCTPRPSPISSAAPGTPVATDVTATGATLTWTAPVYDNGGCPPIHPTVNGYEIRGLPTPVTTTGTGVTTTLTGLAPLTKYTVTIVADESGGPSEPSGSATFTTASDGSVVPYSYAISGAATLKTLTKGNIPLVGSIDAKLTLDTGAFTGDLALNPATVKLTTLGFLPIVAKVSIVPAAPVTGTLTAGKLKALAPVHIKLPSVTVLGLQLAGGTNCGASQVSNIALTSTDAFFNPLSGGTLAGTFSISNLTGCGALQGLISPLTAGAGNAIVLKLIPPALTAS